MSRASRHRTSCVCCPRRSSAREYMALSTRDSPDPRLLQTDQLRTRPALRIQVSTLGHAGKSRSRPQNQDPSGSKTDRPRTGRGRLHPTCSRSHSCKICMPMRPLRPGTCPDCSRCMRRGPQLVRWHQLHTVSVEGCLQG
eukprot:2245464-Prymnesium_polylepis.1